MEMELHAFLTSALNDGEWSASHSSHFNLREGALGTHWIGGWVGPRAFLVAVAKKSPFIVPLPGI
jgi:hypothetical protein